MIEKGGLEKAIWRRVKILYVLMTCINKQHIDCYCIKRVIMKLSSTIVDFIDYMQI